MSNAQMVAVILGADQDTRLRPKALHPLGGQPLIRYAVMTATAVTGEKPVVVLGQAGDQVRAALGETARYVAQAQPSGDRRECTADRRECTADRRECTADRRECTADVQAVWQAYELLRDEAEVVLVTAADMPLVTEATLRGLAEAHLNSGAAVTLLTVAAADPAGRGWVVRDTTGRVQAVVEEAACTAEQLTIRELNAGVYCFDAAWLWEHLPRLPFGPAGGSSLADMVALAAGQRRGIVTVPCADPAEALRIQTRVHLAEAETILRSRVNRRWLEAGAMMLDPAATYIEPSVTIGGDTTLLPNTHLRGKTIIGAHCRIGPGTVIADSRIGDRCVVTMSVLEGVVVQAGSEVGPFEHRRRGY
jgi:bifunctional UDP-N-acetylglucosamine pyrophosphorylase/glucosamine-1-phosphate N-acetyltransferase